MEGEYFAPEDPPSCAITIIVMIAAGFALSIPMMIPIIFADESTYTFYFLLAMVPIILIVFPVSWWGAKRTKKWARLTVERREQESQNND